MPSFCLRMDLERFGGLLFGWWLYCCFGLGVFLSPRWSIEGVTTSQRDWQCPQSPIATGDSWQPAQPRGKKGQRWHRAVLPTGTQLPAEPGTGQLQCPHLSHFREGEEHRLVRYSKRCSPAFLLLHHLFWSQTSQHVLVWKWKNAACDPRRQTQPFCLGQGGWQPV